MTNFDKLLELVIENDAYLELNYDPDNDKSERWNIKVWPDGNENNDHFYAVDKSLDQTAYRILHEMEQADA